MAAAALGPAPPSLAPRAPRYWLAPEAAQAAWAAWRTVARAPGFASGGFLNGQGAGKRRGVVLGEEGGQSVLELKLTDGLCANGSIAGCLG